MKEQRVGAILHQSFAYKIFRFIKLNVATVLNKLSAKKSHFDKK